MIGGLLKSRGARKFRRNRQAVASLVVILLYVLLALWVVGTNTVNDMTGGSLEGKPITGALLRSQIAEPVGAREMPGFGLAGTSEQQYERELFFLTIARRGVDAARKTEAARARAEDPVTAHDPLVALRESELTTRPYADLPLDEVAALVEQGEAVSARVIDRRRQQNDFERLPDFVSEINTRRATLDKVVAREAAGEDVDEDDLLNAREDLGFGLEDLADAVERAQDAGGESNPLSDVDAEALRDLAFEIADAEEGAGPAIDDALLTHIAGAVDSGVAIVEEQKQADIAELRGIVTQVFPIPDGVAGFVLDLKTFLGTDRQGRSILTRGLYSAKIAVQVGVVTAVIAVAFGSILGAAAAFLGGWVDHSVNWVFSLFTSVPYLVLMAVLAFLFLGSPFAGTLVPLYVAFAATYWIGPCRVIRGEVMKIKELEYVQAATAIGFGRGYILLRHIIPNTAHLMFINFSLLFIAAVKGEVILTFLGLGLSDGASWGIMIDQSKQQVVNGFFWQIGAATFFMFVLVLAFNIFTDALQDAFDPRHV